MFHATPSTRRAFLRRSALALAAATPLGVWLAQPVQAKPNDGRGPRSIAVKANNFIDECFRGGREPEVGAVTATAATVTCTDDDGWVSCTYTEGKPTRCMGSGDIAELFSTNGNWEQITVATDPNGLEHGGEIEFTLADAPKSGRTRRKR